MKRILPVLSLLAFILCLAQPATASPKEDEVVEVIKNIWAAWQAKDIATIEKMVAEEYVEFGDHGPYRTVGKAAAMEAWKAILPMLDITMWRVSEPIVQRYGDVAICTYYWSVAGKFGQMTFDESGVATNVLVKKGGSWQLVAEHATHTQQMMR